LTFNAPTSGTYRVSWSFLWRHSSTSNDFRGRVQIDDSQTLWEMLQEPQDSGSDQRCPVSGFAYINPNSGDYDIDLDWCSSSSSSTAYIYNAIVDVWRVS